MSTFGLVTELTVDTKPLRKSASNSENMELSAISCHGGAITSSLAVREVHGPEAHDSA